jgi:hypothetical protein
VVLGAALVVVVALVVVWRWGAIVKTFNNEKKNWLVKTK